MKLIALLPLISAEWNQWMEASYCPGSTLVATETWPKSTYTLEDCSSFCASSADSNAEAFGLVTASEDATGSSLCCDFDIKETDDDVSCFLFEGDTDVFSTMEELGYAFTFEYGTQSQSAISLSASAALAAITLAMNI